MCTAVTDDFHVVFLSLSQIKGHDLSLINANVSTLVNAGFLINQKGEGRKQKLKTAALNFELNPTWKFNRVSVA